MIFLYFVPSDVHLRSFISSEKGKVGVVEDSYCISQSLKGDGVTYAEGSSRSRCSFKPLLERDGYFESWCQSPSARTIPVSDFRAALTSIRLSFH